MFLLPNMCLFCHYLVYIGLVWSGLLKPCKILVQFVHVCKVDFGILCSTKSDWFWLLPYFVFGKYWSDLLIGFVWFGYSVLVVIVLGNIGFVRTDLLNWFGSKTCGHIIGFVINMLEQIKINKKC